MNRLSMGEKILGVSGLLLFILSFLKLWAKVEVDTSGLGDLGDLGGAFDASERFSAWDAYGGLVKLGLVLALVAAVVVIVRAVMPDLEMPIPLGVTYLVIAGITFLAMLLALLIGPDESGSGEAFGISVEISRGIGLFIGTLLGAAMAAGAWLHYQGESAGATAGPAMTPPPTQPPPPTAP